LRSRSSSSLSISTVVVAVAAIAPTGYRESSPPPPAQARATPLPWDASSLLPARVLELCPPRSSRGGAPPAQRFDSSSCITWLPEERVRRAPCKRQSGSASKKRASQSSSRDSFGAHPFPVSPIPLSSSLLAAIRTLAKNPLQFASQLIHRPCPLGNETRTSPGRAIGGCFPLPSLIEIATKSRPRSPRGAGAGSLDFACGCLGAR
jgi:hypothetical protein